MFSFMLCESFFVLASLIVFLPLLKHKEVEDSSTARLLSFRVIEGKENSVLSILVSFSILAAFMAATLLAFNWLGTQKQEHTRTVIIGFFTLPSMVMITVKLFQLVMVKIPNAPLVPTGIVSFAAAAMISSGWWLFPSWLTNDIAAIGIILAILAGIPALPLRPLLIGLCALTVYDIVMVRSGVMTGAAAPWIKGEGLMPPIAIITPDTIFGIKTRGLLGLGDLFFSGLIIRTAAKYGLQYWTLGGYCVGLILSGLASVTWKTGMPALVFLIPVLFLAFFIGRIVQQQKPQLQW
jgi:hypothetical protein